MSIFCFILCLSRGLKEGWITFSVASSAQLLDNLANLMLVGLGKLTNPHFDEDQRRQRQSSAGEGLSLPSQAQHTGQLR